MGVRWYLLVVLCLLLKNELIHRMVQKWRKLLKRLGFLKIKVRKTYLLLHIFYVVTDAHVYS